MVQSGPGLVWVPQLPLCACVGLLYGRGPCDTTTLQLQMSREERCTEQKQHKSRESFVTGHLECYFVLMTVWQPQRLYSTEWQGDYEWRNGETCGGVGAVVPRFAEGLRKSTKHTGEGLQIFGLLFEARILSDV